MGNEKTKALRRYGKVSALGSAVLAALMSGVANSQPDGAGIGEEGSIEEVTVTGSRIRQTAGVYTPTPVTVISNDELGRLGPASLVDAFDNIPSFFNNVNAAQDFSSNVPAAQGTNVNLRGLGPNRTLTLLNGRRVVAGSKHGTVNISNFPTAAVERVEVVTGGASAVYGTDAVAGVTNIILDTDFEGLRTNVQGGVTSEGDNENGKLEVVFGRPIGERAHLILSGEVSGEDGIHDPRDRDWYERWGTIINPEFEATGTGPQRIRARNLVDTRMTCGGLIREPGSALHLLEFNPDGTATPFVHSALSTPDDVFQSLEGGTGSGCAPSNPPDAAPLLTNDLRSRNFFGYFDFDIGDNANVFVQAIDGHGMSSFNGTSATLRAPWNMTIFRDNAFLSPEIAQIMDAEGLTSFSLHRDVSNWLTHGALDVINDTNSYTTGFSMDLTGDGLFDGWRVEGYYQYGKNIQENAFFHNTRIQTLYAAVDAVRHPVTGEIVCNASLVNPDFADCVPINIFGEGNESEEALRYVTTPVEGGINHFFVNHQDVVEITASGEVFNDRQGGPIAVAFGAGYRDESIDSYETGLGAMFDTPTNDVPGMRGIPAANAADPDVHLFGSFADVDGSFDVTEAYAEALVPLASGRVNVTPAARWADYEGSGDIWAYKLGVDWQINEQFRLRGTASHDVRAGTLAERFDRQRANGTVQDDPVTGETHNFSQTTGGNPNIDPEEADVRTVGIVYQSGRLEDFSITVDWYDLDITDAIGRLSTQDIVERCFEGAQSLCDLITRDPLTQRIVDLENVFININNERASGVDFELQYGKNLNGTALEFFDGRDQSINVRFLGTRLNERSTLIPGAPRDDSVGEIPAGGDIRQSAFPEYVLTASLAYNVGRFTAYLHERYLDSGVVNLDDVEGVDIDDNSVDAAWYTNLRLSYTLGDWEIFGQAINLFDEEPPLAPDGGTQTNTGFYDVKGQRFLIGARLVL